MTIRRCFFFDAGMGEFLERKEEGAAKTVSDVNPLVARVCRWAPYT